MATNETVIEGAADTERPSNRRGVHRRASTQRKRQSQSVVAALAVAAAVGGAAAGAHPTGTPVVDPLYSAALAAGVTVAASKARRSSWLVLTAAAVALSRGLLLAPAAASLLLAFASTFSKRRRQRVGALVGALAVQAVLRWPHVGFQGLTALVAAVAIGWCVVSALSHTSSRYRRLVLRTGLGVLGVFVLLSIPAAVAALLAKSPVTEAVANTEGALSAVTSGGTSAALAKLASASTELRTAHSRAGSWWSAGARLVPIVAQQRQAVAGATGAAGALTASAAKEASVVDIHKLGYEDGHFDIAKIRAAGPPIEALNSQVTSAQATLRSLQSGWLAPPIAKRLSSFGAQLDKAGHDVSLGAQVVKAAPGLLGGDGVRHYFVAFMTPAEARGLDGLMGSYALLTVEGGRVTLSTAGPYAPLNADLPPGGARLTGLPEYLHRYGAFHPESNIEDATYSPDLPTVGKALSEMYFQATGDRADGVLALDPYGLAALLQLTGPVSVPGLPVPLSSSSAANILIRTQYQLFSTGEGIPRHDFLQEALRIAFAKLTTNHLPDPASLSRLLGPAVADGRLAFWSSHPADEQVARSLHLADSFPRNPQGDVLAVTFQNAANNKLDAYLEHSVQDDITYNPVSGEVDSHLTVTLHNAAPPDLPPYAAGSYSGSGLPYGTNRVWLSVYSPYSLVAATADGHAATMTASPELGVHVYSIYVTIPSGGMDSLSVHLTGHLHRVARYAIAVRQQPAATPDQYTVTFHVAAPAPISTSSWTPAPRNVDSHDFDVAAPRSGVS